MSIFNNYDTFIERYQNVLLTLSELKEDISELKAKVKGLELENNDLRDKVLRKIQKKTESVEQPIYTAGAKVKNGTTIKN